MGEGMKVKHIGDRSWREGESGRYAKVRGGDHKQRAGEGEVARKLLSGNAIKGEAKR